MARLPVLLVAAVLLVLPGVAAAEPFAVEQRPAAVTALGDLVVWSSFDPQTRTYRLRARRGGTTTVLPVAPSRRPLEPDLGRGPGGAVNVVFSRCDPRCDVHRYDFATRRETRVPAASAPGVGERSPAIDGGTVVYLRGGAVHVAPATGRGRSRPLLRPSGPEMTLLDPEVRAGQVAVVTDEETDLDGSYTAVRTLPVDGRRRPRTVWGVESSGMQVLRVLDPAFDAGARHLYFAMTSSVHGGRLAEFTRATGRLRWAPATRRMVSAAFAGPAAGFALAQAGEELAEPTCERAQCVVGTTGPPRWTARSGL